MNPQDPLAALHPLREPTAIGWWPPAPGWWLLALAFLAVSVFLGAMLARRHRARAYRREAQAQLTQLHARFTQDANAARFAADTNALLKAVALRAYPQHEVAARFGDDWVDFLNRELGGQAANDSARAKPFDSGLADQLYSPEAAQIDAEALLHAARDWIDRHRGAA